jgi:hypothetical protein
MGHVMCVWGSKHQHTIFQAWVGPVRIRQNRTGTSYAELVFLHSVGSAGYAVHFNGFGARNVGSLFFMLTWAWCSLHKKRVRTRYAKLVFLHLMGSVDHIVHFGASGA